DAAPEVDRIHAARMEVLAVDEDVPALPSAGHQLVHAIDATNEGALAASRGTDDGEHVVGRNGDRHASQRVIVAEPGVEVLHLDLGTRAVPAAHRRPPKRCLVMKRAASESAPTIIRRTSDAAQAF